jgi:hypothetical protein
MPITVPAVTIRTTSNSKGHPQGVVTGMGRSPEQALLALEQEAQTQAEKVAAPHSPAAPASRLPSASRVSGRRVMSASGKSTGRPAHPDNPSFSHDAQLEWRFEVVDVRLVPALMEAGESGWLAYGTLLSEGEQPHRSWTDRHGRSQQVGRKIRPEDDL